MKRYYKWWEKIFYSNNPKPTEKLVGPQNERRLPSKNIIGGMEEKKTRVRLRMMLLDCMMKVDYSKLKERAGHRGEWRHWKYEPT